MKFSVIPSFPSMVRSRMSATQSPRNSISSAIINRTLFNFMILISKGWKNKIRPIQYFKTIGFSTRSQGFSIFFKMFTLCTYLKISRRIIKFVSVKMVNYFGSNKRSFQNLFNYISMFKSSSSVRRCNFFITSFRNLTETIFISFHQFNYI